MGKDRLQYFSLALASLLLFTAYESPCTVLQVSDNQLLPECPSAP